MDSRLTGAKNGDAHSTSPNGTGLRWVFGGRPNGPGHASPGLNELQRLSAWDWEHKNERGLEGRDTRISPFQGSRSFTVVTQGVARKLALPWADISRPVGPLSIDFSLNPVPFRLVPNANKAFLPTLGHPRVQAVMRISSPPR